MDEKTHYEVLGVDERASAAEIKRAFADLALRLHPDKASSSDSPAATEAFQRIQQAYEVLKDEKSRAKYVNNLQRTCACAKSLHTCQHLYIRLLSTSIPRYDLELRQTHKKASDVPISMELDLDDLEESEQADGSFVFSKPCRCGGKFIVSEGELDEHSDHVIVQCSICSLFVRVFYTVAPS